MCKRMYLVLVLVALFFGSQVSFAQVTTASISGTVSDEVGAVIPGVTVTARNVETGISRVVLTDDEGRYSALALSLGQFQVQAELAGFQTAIRSGITLSLGRHAVVDLTLRVGEITEQVEVTGEAPLVETTSSSISGLVDAQQIRDLPLNGRDFLQLVTLTPGALLTRSASNNRSQPRGLGIRMSVGGARFNQNTFLMDGSDVNDYSGNTPGSAAGVMLGVDTIREFKVYTNSYSAEYGRQMGGVISAVTRTGTNQFHGNVFNFHRNKVLDARNFFDREEVPPFIRNQFGATAGGPIVKDKTFFMGSYEGVRRKLSQGILETVPSLSARGGVLGGETIPIDPDVAPFLALYPLPNGEDFGNGRAEFFRDANQIIGEDFVMGRIDHNFTDTDSLFGRYTWDSSKISDDGVQSSVSGAAFGFAEGFLETEFNWFTLEYKKVFSPTLLNTVRFAVNRTTSFQDGESRLNLSPDDRFIPLGDAPHGSIGVRGWTTLSLRRFASFSPRRFWYTNFEYHDNLNFTSGRHSFNFGATFKRIHNNYSQVFRNGGDFIFDGIRQFLENDARQFGFLLPDSDPIKGMRQTLGGLFIQDDFKLAPNLTLNFGLRYDFATTWKEVNGKLAVLKDPINDAEHTVTDQLFGNNPSLNNFAPRVGFAWDPTGEGRTSIRGGFGVFYDLLTSAYLSLIHLNPPFLNNGNVNNPPFPDVLDSIIGPGASVSPRADIVVWDARQPYRMQWSLSIQRDLFAGMGASVSYVGSHALNLGRADDGFNVRVPQFLSDGRPFWDPNQPSAPRRNPNFGTFRVRPLDGHSVYHSLQTSLRRRFAQGVQFQIAYTYSKTLDDNSSIFNGNDTSNGEPVMNTFNRLQDRGRADFDIPHSFSSNFTVELPFGSGKPFGAGLTGAADKILSGWGVGGIVTLASGQPFSVVLGFDQAGSSPGRGGRGERPDAVPGVEQVVGVRDQWLNPDAFLLSDSDPSTPCSNDNLAGCETGLLGNLGRNTIDGPGLATFDFQLFKKTDIGERADLEFRAEFFNLFNRSNFNPPSRGNRTSHTASGQISVPGRITATSASSRQIQFGLKLSF